MQAVFLYTVALLAHHCIVSHAPSGQTVGMIIWSTAQHTSMWCNLQSHQSPVDGGNGKQWCAMASKAASRCLSPLPISCHLCSHASDLADLPLSLTCNEDAGVHWSAGDTTLRNSSIGCESFKPNIGYITGYRIISSDRFTTLCCNRDPDTPSNAEQQKSSFMMTSARISVSKASCISEHLTLRVCRSAADSGSNVGTRLVMSASS